MKTFQELRTAGVITYPAAVTNDLKQTISDWFDNREVCDDDKFNAFFNRVLNRDLPRYNQLLRIEDRLGADAVYGGLSAFYNLR